MAFERAEISTAEEERGRLLTFVIIGGGPTGVEMADAIAEVARHALPPDLRRIDYKRIDYKRVESLSSKPVLACLPLFQRTLRIMSRRGE